MVHIKNKSEEFSHSFYKVGSAERAHYESWIGHLNRDAFLEDMQTASNQFMQAAFMVLSVVEPKSGKEFICDLKLNTYIAELFYEYAVEGNPRFLMTFENGNLREINEHDSSQLDFNLDLSTFLSYNELFTSLHESMGGHSPSYSMILVLNMFCARIKLDAYKITGKQRYLSIHELALLAGMKDRSVRNLAYKEIGAIPANEEGITLIPANSAINWLEGRRKFIPSKELKSDAARIALVNIETDFF